MKWARMSKSLSHNRIHFIVMTLMIIVVIALGLLTACQYNTDNTPNGNGNNTNDNNINENDTRYIYATIGDNKLEIELSQNVATNALIERLREGDIIYTARDYGGFEKVGIIGSLPTSDTVIQAEAGDIMLYNGNQIVMFYGRNRYSYTRIGRIKELSSDELRSALNAGNGDIQVTLSLG